MIQPIPKAICGVGYGQVAGTQRVGVMDGQGSATINTGRAPMPTDGIARNFFLYCGDLAHPDVQIDVLLDNVFSGLTLTLPAGQRLAAEVLTEVPYLQGQTLTYLIATAAQLFPGFSIGVCLELEADALSFGVVAQFAGSVSVGALGYAGALGNGVWADNRSTYSINALAGSVTTLVLRGFVAQSGGSWQAHLEKGSITSPVLQDGTGGTINTSCDLPDTDAIAVANFDLQATPGTDHINVRLERLTTAGAFGFEQVAAGIAFVPTIPGQFMFVGGSNDVIWGAALRAWKWTRSQEAGETIALIEVPTGPRAFGVQALYVEHSVNPGTDERFIDTVVVNAIETDLAATVLDAETASSDTGNALVGANSLIALAVDRSSGANTVAKFYWGMAAQLVVGPIRGNIGPIAWLDWTRRQP